MHMYLPKPQASSEYRKELLEITQDIPMFDRPRELQAALVGEFALRMADLEKQVAELRSKNTNHFELTNTPEWKWTWNPRGLLQKNIDRLLKHKLPLSESVMIALLHWPICSDSYLNQVLFPLR